MRVKRLHPSHEAHTLRSNSHASHSPHLLPLGYLDIFSSASTAERRRELMVAVGPVKINVLLLPVAVCAATGLAALRASLAFPPRSPAIEAAALSSSSQSPSPPAAARGQGAGADACCCRSWPDAVTRGANGRSCCCCCCCTCGAAVNSSLLGPAGDFRLREGAGCGAGRWGEGAAVREAIAGLDTRPMCLRGGRERDERGGKRGGQEQRYVHRSIEQ